MKIIFVCPLIGFLKYYGPIIELIKDEKNIELIFAVKKDSRKHNSLYFEENYNKFLEILDLYFNSPEIINIIDTTEKIKCDILFTVTGLHNQKFDYEKHYAIQHSYDNLVHGIYSDNKTIHLCSNEIYGLQLQSKFNTNYIIPPVPVSLSNMETQIEFAKKIISTDKKIITIFFPHKGSIRLVRSVVKFLKYQDYFVIIKQVRKSQAVPKNIGADLIVFDDIWYPSESMFFPLISEIAIGFGSAIYIDLSEVGINIIDNAIPKYARLGKSHYIKPNHKNYWYFDKKFYRNTINTINQISSSNKPINLKIIPKEKLKQFYIDLLKI